MTDPTRHQPFPQTPATQPGRSRKSWIILGVILAATIIPMGGCVACVALLSLSSHTEGDSSASGTRPGGAGGGGGILSGLGSGGALTGTWSGTLDCDDGDSADATVKVSDEGNPLYLYQAKGGPREVEVTSVGQTIRFVPPGGGVYTAVIDSLSVTNDGFSYSTRTSTERASGGTLTQGGGRVSYKAALAGGVLDFEVVSNSSVTLSQPGIVVPGGDGTTTVCRGKLQRE